MIYRPSNSIIERLRAMFHKRVGDTTPAVLGDSDGPGARIDVPKRIGYVYVRFPDGRSETGFALYSSPFMARSAGTAFIYSPGMPVNVGYDDNGELFIKSANYKAMDQAGFNTATLNPLNPQSKWVYAWQLTYGLANAVSTALTGSTLVMVKSFRHYVANRFQTFETPLAADKIDLAAYIPASGLHCLAAVWIDTYTNLPEVTTSTPQALNLAFDNTDVQELVTGRPPDAMPLKAFELGDGQIKIMQGAGETDLRQHMDTPVILGWPQTLDTRERVQDNRTFVIPGDSSIGAGSIDLETGARLLAVHKSTISTSAPSAGDDSADGYSIGSVWFRSSTGILYIASSVGVGTATWVAVAGSGAGTVTSVTASAPLSSTGGTTPVISHNTSGISAGTFTNPSSITFDATGHATSATSGSAPSTPPFVDTTAIVKGSSDATKLLRFEVDGFTTGVTRVMTPPNYDGTIATLAGAEQLDNKTLPSPVINTGVSGSAISDDATFASPSSTTVPTTNAVKGYVDQTVLGLNAKADVRLATAAILPTVTYANGASGVGATLTGVATGVLTIDGVTVALNDRLLIKDQAAGLQNGIYKCTVAGAIGVAFVLTRTTDADTDSELRGGWMIVTEGTANSTQAFVNTNITAITFGTTAITFGEFSAGVIAAGTGLTKSGNTLSLIVPVTIANGGTNATTKTDAFDSLAPTTTQGDIIYHNGTDNVRLPKGTALQYLRMNAGATAEEWATLKAVLVNWQGFDSNTSWTKPNGAFKVCVICIAGGSGGASGRQGLAGTVRGGGAGGGAGTVTQMEYAADQLGSSETIQVGQGGAGGAAQASTSTNGNDGDIGTSTYFGGTTDANSIQVAANITGGGNRGATGNAAGGVGTTVLSTIFQFVGADGGNGGGNPIANATAGSAPSYGPASGGGGAGITAANANTTAGTGGSATGGHFRSPASGGGGAINTAGADAVITSAGEDLFGDGGGGGAAGNAGGNGGFPGGGGGGGGASLNSISSGKGGNGGNGAVIVITWYFL